LWWCPESLLLGVRLDETVIRVPSTATVIIRYLPFLGADAADCVTLANLVSEALDATLPKRRWGAQNRNPLSAVLSRRELPSQKWGPLPMALRFRCEQLFAG
jgi:hypothetical protein